MSIASVSGNHFCIFEVDKTCYAVSALQIREVSAKPDFASVPSSCAVLAGLWHEGSEFLPVLRLPMKADFQIGEAQVLIVDGPHGNWALLVDRVLSITAMDYSPNNDPGETEWSAVTFGMSTWSDRSIRVLHLDGLYRLSEQILKREWQSHFSFLSDSFKSSQLGANG